MDAPRPAPSLVRLSLRELLLILAFVAVACAALKYASGSWRTTLWSALLVAFLGAAIVASVFHGTLRARAIGFVLCVATYVAVVIAGTSEDSPFSELHLPTTGLLRLVYPAVATNEWFDTATDRPISAEQALGAESTGAAYARTSPNFGNYLAVGHLLWALALGYLGSRFAAWVDARRMQREESAAAE